MRKTIKKLIVSVIILIVFGIVFYQTSPYPYALLVRFAFNKEANKINKALEPFTSNNVLTRKHIKYDPSDNEAYLDVYYDKDSVLSKNLPVIVCTHGGGLISGSKEQVGNYCNILASEGYVVISIDYSLAPESKYPKPLVQLNNALHFISNNAEQYHIDSSSIFLAGDSGGSMITAQVANIITNPDYAKLLNIKPKIHEKQLKGLLLYCGIYEIENLNTDGNFGSFLNNVVWSYFGKKEIKEDKFAKTASITNYLTINFPPSFISAGNTDPLLPQSKLLAQKLTHKNVIVDSLFFPEKRKPDLGHEYQFTFNEDGREAFKRSLIFLKTHRK